MGTKILKFIGLVIGLMFMQTVMMRPFGDYILYGVVGYALWKLIDD